MAIIRRSSFAWSWVKYSQMRKNVSISNEIWDFLGSIIKKLKKMLANGFLKLISVMEFSCK